MTNRKMTKEETEALNNFYAKELPIIGGFFNGIADKIYKNFRLYFKDGTQLIACFMTCSDGDNNLELNDPDYDEFYEFYFKVKKIEKKGSELDYQENEGICLNYHNFFIKYELYEGGI